jgi:hypothetical protein
MNLERRFDWKNTDLVYKRANEQDDFEPAKNGMVGFTIQDVTGKVYRGRCYPTTASQMVDTPSGFWKLEMGEKYSQVMPCTELGTKFIPKPSKKASPKVEA